MFNGFGDNDFIRIDPTNLIIMDAASSKEERQLAATLAAIMPECDKFRVQDKWIQHQAVVTFDFGVSKKEGPSTTTLDVAQEFQRALAEKGVNVDVEFSRYDNGNHIIATCLVKDLTKEHDGHAQGMIEHAPLGAEDLTGLAIKPALDNRWSDYVKKGGGAASYLNRTR